jgi:Uma2 family endonuclease
MVEVDLYSETVTLPGALRFPVELRPPPGFEPGRLDTWPAVTGRLEFVEGRLLLMPPCGDLQQDVVTDVVITLGAWVRTHPEFVLGTNEAGMRLGGDTRAADAAIWRRADLGRYEGGFRRAPPILAIEVAGRDESEEHLAEKAGWYLKMGVKAVWVALPKSRELVVWTDRGSQRFADKAPLPEIPDLPGLRPATHELFVQIDVK